MHDPLLASHHRSRATELYSRVAEIHESSARRLRMSGNTEAAERVEHLAAIARLRVGLGWRSRGGAGRGAR